MNILNAENLTKAYGVRKLLDNAAFSLQEGDKVGVIGVNGTGKSTLLKLLAGIEEPDEGELTRARHVMTGYLSQTPVFSQEETVIEAVLRCCRQARAQREQAASGGGRQKGNGAAGAAMDQAEETWQEGSTLAAEAKAMLTRLGVADFDQPCGELSGGQRKRLALVAVLLERADILILDEPTNHLDHAMADWLEGQLKSFRGAIVMVTHDRYFLDSVCNRILEVDHGHLYSYETNYEGYLEAKARREAMEDASQRKRESILRVELEWVRRGARARSTKQKARLERYETMKNTEAPQRSGAVEVSSAVTRMGRTTVELEHVGKAYGSHVLIRDFSYIFLKNDRVGFVGPNGCGKSTLMKLICGMEQPDQGSVTVGQTVRIGYYAQEIGEEQMPPGRRVIDYIRDTAEYVDTAEGKLSAARMLEKFLFAGEDQYGLLGKLSGGERRRLYLLKVLMEAPNVLILDEPTNDLDIMTLQILESYLDTFQGIVIAVSHDRYFLDRVVRRIFAFEEDGNIRQYEGGYTDYARRRELQTADGAGEAGSRSSTERSKSGGHTQAEQPVMDRSSWKSDRPKKRKFTYQEQKDYEVIEEEIAELENRIEALEQESVSAARDFVRLNAIMEEKSRLENRLEEKLERWMYLEDLAARIKAGE